MKIFSRAVLVIASLLTGIAVAQPVVMRISHQVPPAHHMTKLLEGFAAGTPALVNGRSPVLKDHCLRSNAGLYYEDGDEFAETLALVVENDSLRAALGANGRRYVEANYGWEVVLEKYRALIRAVAG